ncbi:elongation of very long chain fatty acids protein 4-like [Homalodisca vitripennis]|uniref:elongation of very long chain fatty acids protein 4-like n=1 Tax=Homalodisca vitripennis TaxID=197043 RepID=UPI001EEB788B|nr:elongation of very long chain fatty acids protein 4-like [Homalodisca vitripennis]
MPALATVLVYLVLVLYVGPRLMAGRKPLQLRKTMMIYNVFQVLFNCWMLYMTLATTDAFKYMVNHSCRPAKVDDLRYTFHIYSWCYFVSKIIDLLDTMFMVLRKKDSHITFLHLYHHVSMVLFTWVSVKYIQAQQGAPPALLNMFVHVIMYGYYFLASLGPWIRPYLWWKRYLTAFQLSQFFLIILYLAILHYHRCYVSQAFNAIWITNVAVIAAFFVNFYIQTYLKKPRSGDKKVL